MSAGPIHAPAGRDSGVALVIVLWMLALLSAIAANISQAVRTEIRMAANLGAMAEAESIATAGVHKAIHELMRPVTDLARWKADAAPHSWTFDDARLRITIRDEAGKVDLNGASLELLDGLFKVAEVPEADAAALAAAVIDWRDADDLRTLHGAEKDDYLEAGRPPPANAPLATVDELRLVKGMTPAIYRRLERLITVYARRNGVSAVTAPEGALLAIPGATPDLVAAYVAQRTAASDAGVPPPPFPLALGQGGPIGFHAIEVEVEMRDNVRLVREAVIRLTSSRTQPYVILAWRSPAAGEPLPSN